MKTKPSRNGAVEGRQPQEPEERVEYLLERLKEIRNHCRWAAGLGGLGALGTLTLPQIQSSAARPYLVALLLLQTVLGMAGTVPWPLTVRSREVDGAVLEDRLRIRNRLLVGSLACAVAALALVVLSLL